MKVFENLKPVLTEEENILPLGSKLVHLEGRVYKVIAVSDMRRKRFIGKLVVLSHPEKVLRESEIREDRQELSSDVGESKSVKIALNAGIPNLPSEPE